LPAVELRRRDDIAAAIRHVQEREIQRRLSRCRGQCGDAAFEVRDALFQNVDSGIGDAAVAIAFGFQIEQRGAMVGAVELIGRGLIDRHRDGVGRRVRVEAGMDRDRFRAHAP